MQCKNTRDLVIRLGKTASIAIGAQTLKLGAVILFYDDAAELFSMSKSLHYSILYPSMVGVSYARFFTRTLKLWERFKPKHKKHGSKLLLLPLGIPPSLNQEQHHKIFLSSDRGYSALDITETDTDTDTEIIVEEVLEHLVNNDANKNKFSTLSVTVYIIGVTRASFLAINAYVSFYAIMRLIGVNDGPGIWVPGIYIVSANFLNFLSYNVSIMAEKTAKIYDKLLTKSSGRKTENIYQSDNSMRRYGRYVCKVINISKTIFIASFGIIGYSLFSYNLTKKALEIPPFSSFVPPKAAEGIAICSGVTSLVSTVLSKGLTLHGALNSNPIKVVKKVKKKFRALIPLHVIMGGIYILTFAFIYYITGVNIFSSAHLDYSLPESILLFTIIAISGAFLEWAFTELKMYYYISKKDHVKSTDTESERLTLDDDIYRTFPREDQSISDNSGEERERNSTYILKDVVIETSDELITGNPEQTTENYRCF